MERSVRVECLVCGCTLDDTLQGTSLELVLAIEARSGSVVLGGEPLPRVGCDTPCRCHVVQAEPRRLRVIVQASRELRALR